AAVSVAFGTVHGLTLGFGTTLIGEAVDYSIYLFVQSAQAGTRGTARPADATRAWVAAYWPTIEYSPSCTRPGKPENSIDANPHTDVSTPSR
ncbi:hypothetical protein, partial [Burkholderia cenocepacia]|uniref:hypothetical protein n=1 Tax=Burkholderia cenocepacia TaxID=95486 RepID=UPI0024B6AF36